MLWLTWRQHRMQVLVTTALLAAIGVTLLINGLGAADFAARNTQAAIDCASAPGTDACAVYTGGMMEWMWSVGEIFGWLPLLAPALIGAFWGAPLLGREFERGTHQLAWTQSVSRSRWLAAKVGGLGFLVTLGGLALGGAVSAWLAVFDSAEFPVNFLSQSWFRLVGIVPAAWWLFAFVLGVAMGAAFRRTVPAMALTLAICAGLFFGLRTVQPMYANPQLAVQTTVVNDVVPDDVLTLNLYWIDRNGSVLTGPDMDLALARPCGTDPTAAKYDECSFKQGYRQVTVFQPADRFWRFQWTETGILLIAAAVVGGVTVRRALRPRI
ncbi:ABC transporter permease [Nonomuraea purpurea]|uniref:ABC transporter permease n=1 Tax=Nonomuraea purpurea TaxID=1849276 RepID=A0ABV8G8H9_9ACTN